MATWRLQQLDKENHTTSPTSSSVITSPSPKRNSNSSFCLQLFRHKANNNNKSTSKKSKPMTTYDKEDMISSSSDDDNCSTTAAPAKKPKILETFEDSSDDDIFVTSKRDTVLPVTTTTQPPISAPLRDLLNSSDDESSTTNSTGRRVFKRRRQKPLKKKSPAKATTISLVDSSSSEDEEDIIKRRVEGVLVECEKIAQKLQNEIQEWCGTSSAEDSKCLTLTGMQTSSKGRRVIKQQDITGLDSSLVLKPYQLVGVNWLYLLYQQNLGGVLADDMGLGKTVQTIVYLSLVNQKNKSTAAATPPHLIIVPVSVIYNWAREFEKFAPKLKVGIYYGNETERREFRLQSASSYDVILTTYGFFERESASADRSFIYKSSYGCLVLDEGHKMKNTKSSRFRRVVPIKSEFRLILSGTPIQNSPQELLSLLSFLMPRIFMKSYDHLDSIFGDSSSSVTKADAKKAKIEQIRKILVPFVLRRLKRDVLTQLPPKTHEDHMLSLGEEQQKLYQSLVDNARAARDGKKLCSEYNPSHVFVQLRKASNHPMLLLNHFKASDLKILATQLNRASAFGSECTDEMVLKEIQTYNDFRLHELCLEYEANPILKKMLLPNDVLFKSAKFDTLKTLLPSLKSSGHRVLLFSQWLNVLDLLEHFLSNLNFAFLRLDGSTPTSDRVELIDEYNDPQSKAFVFLISTKAGGLGINLTSADTVILHDLDFNPSNDEQACDRCHRIGQTREVKIIKLVSKGTVDEAIYNIGHAKTKQNQSILGDNDNNKKTKASEAAFIKHFLNQALEA